MEFGDSLTFFTESRHVYIMPDNLKKEVLAAECIRLSSKLEAFEKGNKDNTIVQTAMSLREQIKSIPFKDHWPPKPGELTPDYFTFHHLYRNFCTFYWVEEKMALLVLPGWLGQ